MRIDLILTDLDAITVDAGRPRAARIGVHHGRIVGLDEELDGVAAARVESLGGATVMPGFVDAHNHMASYGVGRTEIDLSVARSVEEIYAAVAERAETAEPGSWIAGSGYDQNKTGGHPHRDALDRAAPGHPVLLKHTSGHMLVASSAALELGGVLAGAQAPSGGVISVDAGGRPDGLLQEQAQLLVSALRYPYPRGQLVEAIGRASADYVREGITSATEAGIGLGWIGFAPDEAGAYQDARDAGLLRVRVQLMVTTETVFPGGLGLGLRTGFGDDRLRLGAVKVFSDGSLIGRTAAMCCDFADEAGSTGYLQGEEDDLRARILTAHAAGWQVATHAIGDRAVDFALACYAQAQAEHPRPGARHRIEHCGVTRPDQIPELARLGVVPVPQATFVGQIGDGMRAALGEERVGWCYRQRSFLDAGLVVAGSSDRPVVQGAPLLGIHDMVNRRTQSGEPFAPQEAVTPLEALTAYTLGSAYAGHDEDVKGSITPGKLADLAVLAEDPTRIDPTRIRDVAVLATMIGGEFVHGPWS